MNSRRMSNALTNTLECIRGVPERQQRPRARKQDFAKSDLPLPLAELTSSEVCRSRFFEMISIFKSSTQSMHSKQLQILCKHTRQPFGIERRCLRSASNNQRREIQKFPKMHQNLSEIPVWGVFGQNRILKMSHASKFQFWSTKPLPTRPMTIKVFETIQGATTGPMVASESTGTHLFSARKNSKISEIRKSALPRTAENPVYPRSVFGTRM